MTDAFLTASVLAAVAKGTTTIVGIANQRVKECNRIRAMIDELGMSSYFSLTLDDSLLTFRPRLQPSSASSALSSTMV